MGKASNSRPDRVIIRVYLLLSLTLVMTRPIKAQTVVSNENGAKALSITDIVSGIRDFRRANEHNIIRELDAFLKIPNTAADVTNIRRNAHSDLLLPLRWSARRPGGMDGYKTIRSGLTNSVHRGRRQIDSVPGCKYSVRE